MSIKIIQLGPQLTTREIVDAINQIYESSYYTGALLTVSDFGKMVPPTGVDGLLAYANGTDWNPGSSGAGYYRYSTASSGWVRIG